MSLDVKEFLKELATHLAAAAGLEHAATPRQLWIGEAIEEDAVRPYSILRTYGGELPYVPMPAASIQIETAGSKNADPAAWEQAEKLFGALCDSNRRPLRNWKLPGFRIVGILDLRGPAQVRRDDKGGVRLVSNFDVKYAPITLPAALVSNVRFMQMVAGPESEWDWEFAAEGSISVAALPEPAALISGVAPSAYVSRTANSVRYRYAIVADSAYTWLLDAMPKHLAVPGKLINGGQTGTTV